MSEVPSVRVAKIRARLAGLSTPWPWRVEKVDVLHTKIVSSGGDVVSARIDRDRSDNVELNLFIEDGDAELIANAPEDLAFLLAEVERLSAPHPAWKMFMDVGLLWFVNRSLHLFGWAIVLETVPDGSVVGAYPQRVKYRGFAREMEEERFADLTAYLASVAPELEKEAKS